MYKPFTATLVTCLLSIGQASADKELAELYFSDKNPVLTRQEKQAMAIANKWKGYNAIGMVADIRKKRRGNVPVWGSTAQCRLCRVASL